MQPGSGYSIVSGQAGTSLTIDDPQLAGDPEQFRVTIMPTGYGYGVQVRKGSVLWCSYRNTDAWVFSTQSGQIQRFFSYPTGSKTVGPFADQKDSPLMEKGGYVQIQPASVEGGSDSWGVYLLGCGNNMTGFLPYVGIFADGSDAEVKSRYFNGADDQIIVRNLRQLTSLTVQPFEGPPTLITFGACSTLYQYNYNCQRYKVATITWDGSTFVVEQHLLGQTTIPYPVNHHGDYCYEDEPPSWVGSPFYGPQLEDWMGAWAGYDKDSSAFPVQV
jgi:hypothetical protein